MHDIAELHEGHEAHTGNPLVLPVSVTMSILAVLVAAMTLLGHRAHTEELLLQSHAVDQWAYYQAKNIRLHQDQVGVSLLDSISTRDGAKAEQASAQLKQEIEKYQSDKEDIGEKAKEFEAERDVVRRRADRFDGGETLLDIALVICSLTLLTKKRMFWYGGVLLGVAGFLVGLSGFLGH
jgi:hypothetical protein